MSFKTIQAREFLEKKNAGATVIDIRTPAEIREGKIAGASEMDCFAPNFGERLSALDHSKTYLLYCRSGNRSGQVLHIMDTLGFTEVYDLAGGIGEWVKNGNKLH